MPTLIAFSLLLAPAADMPMTIVRCCLLLELAVARALVLALAVAQALALPLALRPILRISSHRPGAASGDARE